MREHWAVLLAVAVAVGALHPHAFAPLPVGAVAVGALVLRRPALLCVGACLLAAGLAHRSMAGLGGLEPHVVDASVTLLTDPVHLGSGVRAEVRLGGRHLQMQASRAVAGDLAKHLAGERLRVRGEVTPIGNPSDWAMSRHLAGRLTVFDWSGGATPDPFSALANAARRRLDTGASVLGDRRSSLFAGLVVGDDRGQPASLIDDFRGAGLTHLLAVSGQNVAFVLALAAPVARRLRLWPRLGVTLVVITGFALLTRFEPSVTRAAAMAALGATAVAVGRPVSRLRIVALATAGLLLVDPLLVWSLGFRLSVAAALAIVVAAGPLTRVLPGPTWLAEPLAVTVAAQIGVAPFLLAAFGPLPVASLPANLLVVPAAGAVMTWGMTAGMVAGWLPPSVAAMAHGPTRALLWWIEAVAARSARAPLGSIGAVGAVAVALGLALLLAASSLGRRWMRTAGLVAIAGALYVSVIAVQAPAPLRDRLLPGLVRWHHGHTDVVVLGGGSWQSTLVEGDVLAALRSAGVTDIDTVIVVDPSVRAGLVDHLTARHPTGRVLVPAGLAPQVRPASAIPVPATGTVITVGALVVTITPGRDRLVVEAIPAGHPDTSGRARATR